MSYPNKKQNKTKTPLPKGLLNYCPSCVYYIRQEPDQPKIKYPCRKSHQQVRKASGINYARDFRDCALYEEIFPLDMCYHMNLQINLDPEKVNVPFLVQILPHKYVEKYKRETLMEELSPDEKLGWKFFLLVLLINVGLVLLLDWAGYAKP